MPDSYPASMPYSITVSEYIELYLDSGFRIPHDEIDVRGFFVVPSFVDPDTISILVTHYARVNPEMMNEYVHELLCAISELKTSKNWPWLKVRMEYRRTDGFDFNEWREWRKKDYWFFPEKHGPAEFSYLVDLDNMEDYEVPDESDPGYEEFADPRGYPGLPVHASLRRSSTEDENSDSKWDDDLVGEGDGTAELDDDFPF